MAGSLFVCASALRLSSSGQDSFTLAMNQHGAQINLKNTVRSDDQITITNIQTHMSCPFRVVRQVRKPFGPGPEWGVESLEPEVNFWGMSFPGKDAAPAPELIDALMECARCQHRELVQLTTEEYRSLITRLWLTRGCPKCKELTEWKFGFVEAGVEAGTWSESVIVNCAP